MAHARSDGYDFRFIDATNSTEYYWELESYNSGTGELIAWINIPELDGDADTVLWLYYGNTDADIDTSTTDTWDANFDIVYHLDEAIGNYNDSTGNANTGIENSILHAQSGKIGLCAGADSISDYIDTTNIVADGTHITWETWLKDSDFKIIFCIDNRELGIGYHPIYFTENKEIHFFSSSAEESEIMDISTHITDNAWNFIVLVLDGNTLHLYVNGVLRFSPAHTGVDYNGKIATLFNRYSHDNPYVQYMDEVRISHATRSGNWISTTYTTQNSPSTFMTFGVEQEQPPPNNPPNKPTYISPTHNQENVLLDTTLKVHVIDMNNNNMSVSFYWSDDTFIETINNVENNTDAETSNLSLDYNTVYNWYTIANDSSLQNTSDIFSFTTIINTPPDKPTNPTPIDNDTNTSIYTTLKVHVIDINNNNMSVSFYWSDDTLIETITDVGNNTYAETSSLNLNRNIEYNWYAVANDSILENTSDTFSFTTTANSPDRPLCVSPTNNAENVSITTTLKVHVIDITNDTMSVSFYWSDDTFIETINNVENNTDAETSSLSLNYETIYNWYAVANDSISETQSYTFNFTTEPEPNYPPNKPTCISPTDNEENVSIATTLKVHVIDMNNNNMSVSFYWENNTLIESISDINNNTDAESSSLLFESNTIYKWYAVANDSLLETQSDTFTFTTGENAVPFFKHVIPRLEPDGHLYMIYRNGNINVSNLNILMGSYSPFTVWKYNYTSQDWDDDNFMINNNDYIKTKINESDMPYNDTLIPIIPQLRFKITDADEGDKLDIMVTSNSSGEWEVIEQWSNVSQGWFVCEDDNMDEYNTTYYYSIDVIDSYNNTLVSDFSFTTTSIEPAIPSIITTYTYKYITFALVILASIGGGMYVLSAKKRKR